MDTTILKNKPLYLGISIVALLVLGLKFWIQPYSSTHIASNDEIAFAVIEPRSFDVDIRTVGELEASNSIIVSSAVKGDFGKIIDLVKDGAQVNPGDLLVKMDPTPFEEKVQELQYRIKEQEAYVAACEQLLESEQSQIQHENKLAEFEVETAELEWNKIVYGDGPMEISKLKSALQKTQVKYEELEGYSKDLIALQEKGYLNTVELKQAQKKLGEEKEAFENAKLQYESYVNHVYPMQVKKADSGLKKAKLRQEETVKTGGFKIGKALAALEQGIQELDDLHLQLDTSQKELALCEIKALTPGMVVLREDYRSGQRRKPRVGDSVLKNQPILDLPDLTSMIVKTKVREIDLYKIDIGKPSSIEVDAYPNLQFNGKVQWIGVLAMTDPGRGPDEKYFEVKVELENPDHRLRPGMTARVTIHAAKIVDKVAVPSHAIFNINKKNYCYVKGWRGIEERPVEVGVGNEHWIEITSGLSSGEHVCLTAPYITKK